MASAGGDSFSATQFIGLMVAMFALAAVFLYIDGRKNKPEYEKWRVAAERLGATYNAPEGALDMPSMRYESGDVIVDVSVGRGGDQVSLVAAGSTVDSVEEAWLSVWFPAASDTEWTLEARSGNKHPSQLGLGASAAVEVAAFNKAFKAKTDDVTEMNAFFTAPRRRAAFDAAALLGSCKIKQGRVFGTMSLPIGTPDRMVDAVERLAAIGEVFASRQG